MKQATLLTLLILTMVAGSSCLKNPSESELASQDLILKQSDVIYGKDDRKDLYSVTNPEILKLTKYVGVQTSTYSLGYDSGKQNYYLNARTLGERKTKVCADEYINFKDQISPGRCSGFLITPKLYLTMGHCLSPDEEVKSDDIEKINEIDISAIRIIFNFFQPADHSEITIAAKDVYSIKRIVEMNYSGKSDYAILELNREFPEKINLKFERTKKTREGDPIVMIGSPNGIPVKISDNATVKKITKKKYITDLDAFHGNSGSMVYNLYTKEIIGILESGEEDFIEDKKNKCDRVTVFTKKSDLQKGSEEVEKIMRVIEKHPDLFK